MVTVLIPLIIAAGLAGGRMHAASPDGILPFGITQYRLDNGLSVIMIPRPGSGLMTYYSIVRTGSRDEYEEGKTGFAHFFEHMMFRGTKNYPAAVYDRMITAMGADANAYTTDDYTAYHLSFATEDLETVVTLESDRFQFLEYSEEAFQTEAGAVYGEYRKNRSNPWEVLSEALRKTAYTSHTYRHTTIGFEADIKAMPGLYKYSKEFFLRHYRPENTVLMLTGDFDPADARTLIDTYYGAWQPGYVAPDIPAEPEQREQRRVNISYGGQTLPLLAVSWKGEPLKPASRRMAAGRMLGELLFGEGSALYKKLVLKEQKVQYLAVDFGLNRDPGLWSVMAAVKNTKDIRYVLSEIDKTVERYRKAAPAKDELARLKRRIRYAFLMELDTPDQIAARLARYIGVTGGIDAVNQLFASYAAVTPDELRDAAAALLKKERRTIAVLTGRK
jgi:zinc protease